MSVHVAADVNWFLDYHEHDWHKFLHIQWKLIKSALSECIVYLFEFGAHIVTVETQNQRNIHAKDKTANGA